MWYGNALGWFCVRIIYILDSRNDHLANRCQTFRCEWVYVCVLCANVLARRRVWIYVFIIRFEICLSNAWIPFLFIRLFTVAVDLNDLLSRIQMRIYGSRKNAKVTTWMKDIHSIVRITYSFFIDIANEDSITCMIDAPSNRCLTVTSILLINKQLPPVYLNTFLINRI